MNRRAFCLSLAGLPLLAAEEAPKAEGILERFIEVTGGKAVYEKIHNELSKGTIEFMGRGIKGTLVSYEAEGHLEYSVADASGVGKMESGSDGNVFWERSAIAGPRIKTGEEREEIARAGIFQPYLNWRKIYEKAELAGSEVVDGDDCYKIVLTPKVGKPVSQFFSKKSGLLLKTSSVHATQMGDIPAEAFLRDYKASSGILISFARLERFAGQEIQIHLDSVEFNAEIPKERFELPDDIKALVRKNGATK
jgi:hypothetical protein